MSPSGSTLTEVLTGKMRSSPASDYVALRTALISAGFDPEQVAVADFHSEGTSVIDGTEVEWMWLTMVTASGAAYVGDLMISDHGEYVRRLVEVPARPIPDVSALAQRLNENRRRRDPWNAGLPDWITSPDDFLYNREIQEAAAFVAGEQRQA
jgi:hypothetical protein